MILVDDKKIWSDLLPLTFTKSIAELRVGGLTLQEKWQHHFPNETIGIKYCQDYLNHENETHSGVKISSHIIPNPSLCKAIKELSENTILVQGDTIIAEKNIQNAARKIDYNGDLSSISFPWELYSLNHQEIINDIGLLKKGKEFQKIHNTCIALGDEIFIEEGAEVKCAILNSETGPIYISKNAKVLEGAMIRGPFFLGENSQVNMGTKIYTGSSIGPYCKVGGEITNSIFQGYSNKGHDGFLGNSVIGEWCNLGADTNSSNLKNNYSPVSIYNYSQDRMIDSGQQFLGLIMGDYSKCGINTMFNTGTVVGVCANIFGGGFPDKHIPSFSWCNVKDIQLYDIEKAIDTIRIVYGRRGQELGKRQEQILRHLHSQSKL